MIHNQAGNQQSEINKNANDDNCLDNSELYGKREGIYSVAINKRQMRPAKLEPATFGFEDRNSINTSLEKSKTCKISKEQLTPQLKPKSQQQAKIDAAPLPSELAEIVVVWTELPEHIEVAIKLLIQIYIREKD